MENVNRCLVPTIALIAIVGNVQFLCAKKHDLIHMLYDNAIVQFGSFTLRSGAESSVYIDMRNAYGNVSLMKQLAQEALETIADITYDCICPVPYGAIPFATAMSLSAEKPLIVLRKEAKKYGTEKRIEGQWHVGTRVMLVEDVVTTGQSIIEVVTALEKEDLIIAGIIVLLDREQGGVQTIENFGYPVRSLLKLSDIVVYKDGENN
jgi:uridine monophosphate synthetase